MSSSLAGFLQLGLLVVALAACYQPLGDYIARIFTSEKHLRAEKALYKTMGVEADADQRWGTYARSLLAFSLISVLFLYLIQRIQEWLPYSNGISGFTRNKTDRLGNFWVDLTRVTIRLLLPMSVIGAIILTATGVVDNFSLTHTISTLAHNPQSIVGGPVASQEVIKEMGNNGGGFYNANSAHPFENPGPFSNWFEIFLILVIPFALPRAFGKMVNDNRQGYVLVAVMASLWLISVAGISYFEWQHAGLALQSAGAAMEGKEVRFGIPGSSLFAGSTTVTSTGAVNSLDPDISPQYADIQVNRVAIARHWPAATVRALVGKYTQGRTLGFLGEPRVDVLNLNIALDQLTS
jgi:K+-transporting ATPase ATPase A chain